MNQEIIALPVFGERISPLLDEARKFSVITVNNDTIVERTIVEIDEQSPFIRIERLKEMGATVIICGAVSETLARFIVERELHLYSWLTGTIDEIVEDYIHNTMPHSCMRYVQSVSNLRVCKRHRRGWKVQQRGDINENSNTSSKQ